MPYRQLRKGRCSESGRAYFITTVTCERKAYFNNLFCARELVKCIRNIHDAGIAQSLCWVIMPDHFHWLIRLNQTPLSTVMNKFKGTSSRRINLKLNRNGRLWQKSYYDRAIRDNEDIKNVARYIVANPLRAGLVSDIGKYSQWDAVWL